MNNKIFFPKNINLPKPMTGISVDAATLNVANEKSSILKIADVASPYVP